MHPPRELRQCQLSYGNPAELAARSGASCNRRANLALSLPHPEPAAPQLRGSAWHTCCSIFPALSRFPAAGEAQSRRAVRAVPGALGSARLGSVRPRPPQPAPLCMQSTAPPRSPRYNRFPYIGHHSAFLVTGLTGSKLNLVNCTDSIRVRVPEVCSERRTLYLQ